MRIAATLIPALLAIAAPGDRPVRAATAPVAPAARSCADFLAQMHKKPSHLDFVGCTFLPDRQGKPLRATYRVGGGFAAVTEAALIRAVGLNRLRRSCCQWDSPPHAFVDSRGRRFKITMVSADTAATSRADWGGIPTFEVTVETLTEDI